MCRICDSSDCDGCNYGPGEMPAHLMSDYTLCEVCCENQGVTNSQFIFGDDEDDVGVWICNDCEEYARDPYFDHDGEYQIDYGGYVSPFIDEER